MRDLPAILILAAGDSRRMRGGDKLLEPVDGTPLILRAVRAATAASPEVIVALPPNSPRRCWLGDVSARIVEVPERAMSASIRRGVENCRANALMIHLADMPEIEAADLEALAQAWTETDTPILQATTEDGKRGQPVIFARSLFEDLFELEGDMGARPLIARHPVAHHVLPGQRATTDLDTPEDWAEWRRRTGRLS
ncbi:Purine catabolism protein PucB [Jannaschia seosinensis]|uniref:Purine catabolism protein PucB n=1 Tax=Jannaschia seosinensis TaxID=313367 RepID=A0A0M7BEH6_9RHOB|nr:nucleotidyltransferase family protein [Jannaschia seosinensis]CUH40801.1 Purine catabolism protein PucB [Jannaschia seosinensis]